jgi:hypothetical protein
MNEKEMVQAVQAAVVRSGVDDEICAAGLFNPRGHSGSAFVGGLIGGDVGGSIGVGGVGTVGGLIAAQKVHDASSGLPEEMLVGVSDTAVYGFEAHKKHELEATRLVFRLERSRLDVKVHGRFNVRVLELVHSDTGSSVQLEGLRFPGIHAGDVIHTLQS